MLMDDWIIIGSGLDLDFRGDPFPVTASLLALADHVHKLAAVCNKRLASGEVCGEAAYRSQRLTGGKDVVEVGDREYAPRCHRCFEPPG
jgi:thymidine kinase